MNTKKNKRKISKKLEINNYLVLDHQFIRKWIIFLFKINYRIFFCFYCCFDKRLLNDSLKFLLNLIKNSKLNEYETTYMYSTTFTATGPKAE